MLRYVFDHYDTESIEAMKDIFGEDDVNELMFDTTEPNPDSQKFSLELELRRR